MTRMARSNAESSGQAIAGLHEQGQDLALVILRTGARPAVSSARVYKRGQEAEIVAALAAAGAVHLTRTAPARRTVCRVLPVPAGTPEEMAGAASLAAEGALPEEIPAHRRGAGILPGAGPGGAFALLTAWRPGTEDIAEIPWPDESWTTEIAALAFLAGPRASAVAAHPGGGAVSIIARGSDRTVARVLIESAEASRWDAAVARHVAETCAAIGAEAPPRGRALQLTDGAAAALRSAVSGVPSDPAWLETYGLALGAAMVASAREPGAQGLARLQDLPPSQRLPWPERAASWLSVPRHAAALIALSLVIALLSPLGFSAARGSILSRKAAGLSDQDRVREDVQKRAALFREMEQVRWPMTKLLADMSAATPEGVTIDSVTLAPDQGLMLKGSAENQELLTQLQKRFNDTGLFEKLKVARAETTSAGVSFDLSADIVSPHTPVNRSDDFAAKPLAVRLYGEGAGASSGSAGHATPADDNGPRRDGRSGGAREDRADRRNRNGDGPSARPAPARLDIPPPLTDAQIAALDRAGAMKEWSYRKRVAGSAQVDAPTKERLEQEIPKLAERMKQAGSGG